ncbi:kelch repeat-containing protein [Clostridium sp. CCUG 7971]|uniref:Kelch repeat-containing protein n=1 Tax=Clostridium sp. CCUG 7971 TaxID=2811414 RepID=UPI001ABBE000|nr:kelch repeat-containing protein [Clostridium sp. CCUG 7971]MBO3444005.1 hypothetical protein [Clostridium sp. CCUG 7971]
MKFNDNGRLKLFATSYFHTMSWNDYNAKGCVFGKEINIQGTRYKAMMPKGSDTDPCSITDTGSRGDFGRLIEGCWDDIKSDINIPQWVMCQETIIGDSGEFLGVMLNNSLNGTKSIALSGYAFHPFLIKIAPYITSNTKDLGEIYTSPTFTYTINSDEGQDIATDHICNNAVVESFPSAPSGTTRNFTLSQDEWDNIPYGDGKFKVIASYNDGAQGLPYIINFYKAKKTTPQLTEPNLTKLINQIKSTDEDMDYQLFRFRGSLKDKGLEVTKEDKISSLIDKVSEMKNYPNLPKWYELDKVWIKLANIPTPRSNLAVEVIGNKVYALGGYDGRAGKHNECYDFATNTWTTKTPPPQIRYHISSAVFGSEIHIFGGTDGISSKDSNYMYDTVGNTWTEKAGLPRTISEHKSVCAGGKAYIVGGFQEYNVYNNYTYIYDKAGNTWTSTIARTSRANHGMYFDITNNKIYSFGGHGSSMTSSMDIYDISSNTWKGSISMPNGVCDFVVGDIDGKICVFGGSTDKDIPKPSGKTYSFNILTQKWDSDVEPLAPFFIYGSNGANIGKNIIMLGGYKNAEVQCLIKK